MKHILILLLLLSVRSYSQNNDLIINQLHDEKQKNTIILNNYKTVFTDTINKSKSYYKLNDSVIFCNSGNVVSKSTDFGITWIHIFALPNPDISWYNFINESVGFAYTLDGIVYKTIDGGNKWSMIYNNPSTFIFHVCLKTNNEAIIYLKDKKTNKPFILYTFDGGISFHRSVDILDINYVSKIGFNNGVYYVFTVTNKLYTSLDGVMWTYNKTINMSTVKYSKCGSVYVNDDIVKPLTLVTIK